MTFDPARVVALPETLLAPDLGSRGDRRPRLINTGYGGSVAKSFSGSGAYLAEAGIATGTLDGAFELYSSQHADRQLQARGALWKLQRKLNRQRSGGFKFAPSFSEHLWHKHASALAGSDVVSTFQLLSDEVFAQRRANDLRVFFYIDGTLHDYLRGYAAYDVADIDPHTIDVAVEAERRGYEQADGIAVMSEFTARTMTSVYGVPRDRVRVVAPGANLPDGMAERVIAARRERTAADEIVVGFVGVYPERKGLPKLADAVRSLRADGLPVRLRVVGRCPDDIASRDGVDALGLINKNEEPEKFVAALAGMDLGCQLSTVEMFGIALLEFLRCEIPILATRVGGASDILEHGGSLAVDGDATVDEVADTLRRFVTDEQLRRRLQHEAALRGPHVTWAATANALGDLVAAGR